MAHKLQFSQRDFESSGKIGVSLDDLVRYRGLDKEAQPNAFAYGSVSVLLRADDPADCGAGYHHPVAARPNPGAVL